tara:strand:- start:213 stop:539 length:327 start_codon:yes stop_codon:yes gene_type:complete
MSLLNDPLNLAFMKQSDKNRPIRSATIATTEAAYQRKLIKKYETEGWHVLKLLMLNKAGYPDLILLKPNEVKFVEVKRKNGRLSKIQEYRIEELRRIGFEVIVARSPD